MILPVWLFLSSDGRTSWTRVQSLFSRADGSVRAGSFPGWPATLSVQFFARVLSRFDSILAPGRSWYTRTGIGFTAETTAISSRRGLTCPGPAKEGSVKKLTVFAAVLRDPSCSAPVSAPEEPPFFGTCGNRWPCCHCFSSFLSSKDEKPDNNHAGSLIMISRLQEEAASASLRMRSETEECSWKRAPT